MVFRQLQYKISIMKRKNKANNKEWERDVSISQSEMAC